MWIIYALLTAFFLATSDMLTKRVLATGDEYFVAWARLVFALPLLAASLFFIEVPPLNRTFWTATLCAIPLEITAIILYTRALKISPISLTMPFLALTPLFLIVISYFIAGERISFSGGVGIVLMALGSYMLSFHKIRHSLAEPFKAIFRDKGCVLMIIVAFIYSMTSSLGKVAISNSSAVFFGSFYFMLIALLFTPITLIMNKGKIRMTRKDIIPLSAIGITQSLMIIFHMTAMSMTKVAYMISVKRTSLLFSIIYGYFIFREEKIAEKTVGALMMLTGFLMIVLGGK
ncbi:MAG: DMT family transporter [Nitrospiraceae bacterium]|nr:MAG: DMT family transporter [Nitrospiraceae bacterium]